MPTRRAVAALNVARGHYDGYRAGDPLALLTSRADAIGPVLFALDAADTQDVLDQMWQVGNRSRADAHGRRWPADVRSLSIGDVLVVYPPEFPLAPGAVETFTVVPVGFNPIAVDVMQGGGWARLEGTDATSRPAVRVGSSRPFDVLPEGPGAGRESL